MEELARVNRIRPEAILPIRFLLYIPQRPKRNINSNAYIEPRGNQVSENLKQAAREASPYLTHLGAFSFQAQRDGTLKEPPLDQLPQIAAQSRAVLSMVVTNLENDKFSDELGRILLNNQSVKATFLNEIVRVAKKYQFKEIHFDFEYLRPADKDAYIQF